MNLDPLELDKVRGSAARIVNLWKQLLPKMLCILHLHCEHMTYRSIYIYTQTYIMMYCIYLYTHACIHTHTRIYTVIDIAWYNITYYNLSRHETMEQPINNRRPPHRISLAELELNRWPARHIAPQPIMGAEAVFNDDWYWWLVRVDAYCCKG